MKDTMIATLGHEPQVVTIALDCLLKYKHKISEVVVVLTQSPTVLDALQIIENEFAIGTYPGVTLKSVIIEDNTKPIQDFRTQEDLNSLMRVLYAEVRKCRERECTVHLCLAGGRKVMGLLGMVVAQLLFGIDDKVWYLVTEGWKPGEARKLHLSSDDQVWLLPIPVIRWNEARSLMVQVAEITDTAEVVTWFERFNQENQLKRKEEFINHWLSPAQREVVSLVAKGLNNAEVAKRLAKSEQTVANQLSDIYAKLEEWLEYPDTKVDRSKLMAEFSPYFA